LQSMVDKIPQLPRVDLVLPESVMGKGTVHAIQSGMLYGTVAQIEGLANRIEKEVGQPCTRLLTGGYTTIFKQLLPDFIYEEHLVNDGLLEIYLNKMYK
jgi:type III pantothenate kinase